MTDIKSAIDVQLNQLVVDFRNNCLFSYNDGSFHLNTEFMEELDTKVAEYLELPVENRPNFYVIDQNQMEIQIADIDDFRNQASEYFDQIWATFLPIYNQLIEARRGA